MKIILLFAIAATQILLAEELSPAKKIALDKSIQLVKTWAADSKIVHAVKSANEKPQFVDMNQDKWTKVTLLDPVVKALAKGEAADTLRSVKTPAVAEAFLNSADGTKVGFISKPTNWSHKGKPKHEEPMKNATWIGKIEVDESSGKNQIQVSVPVLDAGKPIGSMVVGFDVDELK